MISLDTHSSKLLFVEKNKLVTFFLWPIFDVYVHFHKKLIFYKGAAFSPP